MFNGYNDTPPLISFNDFDQEKEKKQENASKWSCGYDAGGPPAQAPGHGHQGAEFWSPKPSFLGNAPGGNAPSKCNCSGCYSTDNQSYQNVSTRHRPWLPRTFPVPLNGSSETCKLPDYHQLDGINLTNQGSCFVESNGVAPPYFQDYSGKHSHYRHYQNSRLPESNQPGVISSTVNSDYSKKEFFQNQREEISPNVIGQDLSFLRQNGTRQPVYCNTSYGIIRNVEARLNSRNRGSNICDSLEKYSNVDLYRHPNSAASYPLDQHISRPSVVEPYIKAVPSNLNQNRVPSIGHRNSKENMSQPYVEKVYNDSKKNISSDMFQTLNVDKKSVLPATFQSPLIKEGGSTSDNYQAAPLHGFPSPVALNLKNNGVPIDCTYFNINRDFSKSCGNLSEAETQKLLYMSDRYSDYFSKNNLPDVIKRNSQSHMLDGKKECAINQISQKNYYEQQPNNNLHRSNVISNGAEYMESKNTKAPFGASYSKELESAKASKTEMFDLLQDNPAIFQRKEEMKNDSMNVHPRLPRPAPVFNDPRSLCAPGKPQNCFSSPNGATIPFSNFINSDYSYQGHHVQGHHTYSYPHSSVPFQRNDLNQYNQANLYQQISHGNSQPLTMHSNGTIIFNSQTQPLTNSEVASQQFCSVKNHNIESKPSIPQNENPRLCSPLEAKKPNYLETIRSEEINKNGNSKISPLRLLRKKKFMNQNNEVANETIPPSANSSDLVTTLDVRKFWSTWAEEEEENVAPTQVVVLDCQNIGVEEARLLHLYENESVRALHLENGNLVTFREPDCDKILTDNANQCDGDTRESGIHGEQIEIVNEIKNGAREEISKPANASQEAIVQPEEILSKSKSLSENLQAEMPEILEGKTKITEVEPSATKLATDELTSNKKSLEVTSSEKNEMKSNFHQENTEKVRSKNFRSGKKPDGEALKLDRWTEKKFDFLKRAEESKAAEILRNSEEKKRIFERRYSFQQCNLHHETKKNSVEISNLSDSEITPTKSDASETKNSFSELAVLEAPKGDSTKNFSVKGIPQEFLQRNDKGKFSNLPTSEYRRNKFLNYSGKKITLPNEHSNAPDNEKKIANLGANRNCYDKVKPTVNSLNSFSESLSDPGGEDIKKEEKLKLEHCNNSWPLKNKDLPDLDEKKFQAPNESAITFANLKEETGYHNFEMDDILQKMSNINFRSSEVKADSCLDNTKNHETKPVKVKKLKTLSAGKKIKKSKKSNHMQEDEELENGATENISLGKPTIKFSIQKLHDLKISFKVLNGGKKYEKCTKDEDVWEKKIERTDSVQNSSNATELITLKLKSIQRDDTACDITKLDQKFSRNGILKKEKKRFKRKKLGVGDSSLASDLKYHKNKSKKCGDGRHVIREEKDPLAQDSNDEILLSVIEKQSEKYSSSDDFQVQETVDSAKIKLTFKRHKPCFSASSPTAVQNSSTDHENRSKCISRSSKMANPLFTEKSILKFDSPSEKELQFIKSEENWFDEFSESYNNLDGISEESQADCSSTGFPSQISSSYISRNDNNYDGDVFTENGRSPENNSHDFSDTEDQCDSQGFENVESSDNKMAKAENDMLNESNEEENLPYYSMTNENYIDDDNDEDDDDDRIRNKNSNFEDVATDKGYCETEVESLESNLLDCDEDSNHTDICDESFMDCGSDITMENFQDVDGRELQIKDPLNRDPIVKGDVTKEKDDCTNYVDMENTLSEELIKCSTADAEEEICDLEKVNSQSSVTDKNFTKEYSNEVDPLQDEMELMNRNCNRATINKEKNVEKLLENIKGDKNEKSDCSTNHLKHSHKINGSYEFKSDVKVSVGDEVNFSSDEMDNSQTVEQEAENTLKKETLGDLPDEIAETENIGTELSTPKDGAKFISSVLDISHSEETGATRDKNCVNCDDLENDKAKETVISLKLNENRSENVNEENTEKDKITAFCETYTNINENDSGVIAAELEEKIKVQLLAKPVMQNTVEWAVDIENDPIAPEGEKQFLNDLIDIVSSTSKSNCNNDIFSRSENIIEHSTIANNAICSRADKYVKNDETSENNPIINSTEIVDTNTSELSDSNRLKKNLETINTTAEIERLTEELHASEEIIQCNENYESSQTDKVEDMGEINDETVEGVLEKFIGPDKTEIKHMPSPEHLDPEKVAVAVKNEETAEKLTVSKSKNVEDPEQTKLLRILKEFTRGRARKIQRRNSFTQKNFFENKWNRVEGSQKVKSSKIIFDDILKSKSDYGVCKRRHQKSKSCPPLQFHHPQIGPTQIVTLNIPVEDIPLPVGDPPPENCFDFVEFFKKRKLENAIKSPLETDPNQLEINEKADGWLPVDPKMCGTTTWQDNQNQSYVSQKEISQLLQSLVNNCERPFQFCDLQNCRNPSPPPDTVDENSSFDIEKNLRLSKTEINDSNSISTREIDIEEINSRTENNCSTSHTKNITPPESSTNKTCDETKIRNFGSSNSGESIVEKDLNCRKEKSENKEENENLMLESLVKKFEGEEREKKSTRRVEEVKEIEPVTIEDLAATETVKPTENFDEFDRNMTESQIEVVCEKFEIDVIGKDFTMVADDETKSVLEIQSGKLIEDKYYECEDIPTSEDLPNDDDITVEKVSDDDRFRHVMQNCLDNAKKFLNVSNLKLFSCSVEDLLEMDCQFTDVNVEDCEPEKSAPDTTNHISKDVLLTSCDNEVNDDLILSEKFQLNDLSMDFVPSFTSEGPHNLCPEILPVDNWPYLEEEVPSSPTKSKADETELIPPLENGEMSFEKSCESQEGPIRNRNHTAFYAKNKLNKIRDGLDKLVNCNIVSLPSISHVDFKRFRRRSVVSDNERPGTNSKIGCQRRRTIDCLASNQLMYSAFNKDMHHFKTEVAKLKSGLEKIENLWHKRKSLKCSLNVAKMKKSKSKDDKSVKRTQSCPENECSVQSVGEAKNVKDSFKQDSFEVPKSSETISQREKNNFYFKSPTWQPKVLLFRISKKQLKKVNKSSFPCFTSKENNCKRISKKSFIKRHKDSREVFQAADSRDESVTRTSKQENSRLNLNKDLVHCSPSIKDGKSDKVKVYVKSGIKDSCEEREKLSGLTYRADNFKSKMGHDAFSSSNCTFDNGPQRDKQAKRESYSFTSDTNKGSERNESGELNFVENQVAPVKRKKSRFRNLHSKRKRHSSSSDTDSIIPFKRNLPANPTLVETERVLSELFRENNVSKDVNLKSKNKSLKDFVSNDRIKEDDGRERKKNRHADIIRSDSPEKGARNVRDGACAQNIEFSDPHLKNNSREHYAKQNDSALCERTVESSKHEIAVTAFSDDKKFSVRNFKHIKSETSAFQKHDVVAFKKDPSEKSKSKNRPTEKPHRESSESRESRHSSDHRSKKRHDREKEEKREFLKHKDLAHFSKKKLPNWEESRKLKESKLKKSMQNILSRSGDSKTEKRMKTEESSPEELWVCEVCGFNDANERMTHIKSHPFHCQSCHLAFNTEAHFINHLTKMHKDIKNQHHCLLCELSFDTETEYQKHLETREHKHLESVEKNTINTLFTLLTGQPCPALGLAEMKPEWLPNQAGMVHFYHQATPLSLALQLFGVVSEMISLSRKVNQKESRRERKRKILEPG